MSTERVRVVILNYNAPVLTQQCVSNVLNQSYTPLDIVVVDNASSPENIAELERLIPEHVTLVKNPVNSGYAAGNNVGARLQSITPPIFTMILNPDVLFNDTNSIKKLVEALKKHPNRVAISPLVHNTALGNMKPEMQVQVRRDPDFKTCLIVGSWWLRRIGFLKKIADRHFYKDLMPYSLNEEYDCDSINGCCFIIRHDFLEDIGYLDEGTFLYYEEIILGRQIKMRGKKCCLLTSIWVDHFQGSTTKYRPAQKNISFKMYKEAVKSELYFCKKYLNSGFFGQLLILAVRIIDFTTKIAIFLLLGYGQMFFHNSNCSEAAKNA
jgi:GT2 family glycosyltransferase